MRSREYSRKILNPKQIQITEIQRFKNGFRIPRLRHSRAGECGMTDVGLILFGGQILRFAQNDRRGRNWRIRGLEQLRSRTGQVHSCFFLLNCCIPGAIVTCEYCN